MTNDRPTVLLAFGAAANTWSLETYRPLVDRFDVRLLTTRRLSSGLEELLVRSRSSWIPGPAPVRRIGAAALQRALPFWDRVGSFRHHARTCRLVHTLELAGPLSFQAAAYKRQLGYRLVVTAWENIALRQSHRADVRKAKRRVVDAADAFIAITERARTALLLEGVEPERIVVLPPAVEPDGADGPSPGTSSGRFHFLYVGKKQRSKGIAELLQAMRLLAMDPDVSGPRIQLTCVGIRPSRGPYARWIREWDLEDRIQEYDFLPYHEARRWYRRADCLVLPSRVTPLWQEQFGMVLVEAMQAGLPIVTTRSGSIPEVAGDAAWYVQPNDHHSLYQGMKRLVADAGLRRQLAEAGRRNAAGRYRAADVSAALQRVYDRVLNGKLPYDKDVPCGKSFKISAQAG